MMLEEALRWMEYALAFAVVQRSVEHLNHTEKHWSWGEIAGAAALASGLAPAASAVALWAMCVAALCRFHGPYNGGADKMLVLALTTLAVARVWPAGAELAIGYLALQLILSYAVSGWVKLCNPAWRKGEALSDVFAFSIYPVSADLQSWAQHRRILFCASWAVIGFEFFFPAALLHPNALLGALALGALFHFANAYFFGLNRFLWAWLSAYPALIWFQARFFTAGLVG